MGGEFTYLGVTYFFIALADVLINLYLLLYSFYLTVVYSPEYIAVVICGLLGFGCSIYLISLKITNQNTQEIRETCVFFMTSQVVIFIVLLSSPIDGYRTVDFKTSAEKIGALLVIIFMFIGPICHGFHWYMYCSRRDTRNHVKDNTIVARPDPAISNVESDGSVMTPSIDSREDESLNNAFFTPSDTPRPPPYEVSMPTLPALSHTREPV